jgi:hypothetical protein
MLAAVENAPPVAAADVLGQQLAQAMDASEVSFLIADFSGDLLIRLSHDETMPTSSPDRDVAECVSMDGSAHGRALAAQAVQVDRQAGGWRVLAPVTNRGEAIGVLELRATEVIAGLDHLAPDDKAPHLVADRVRHHPLQHAG